MWHLSRPSSKFELASLLILACQISYGAETSKNNNDFVIEEMIVSAQMRAQSSQSTPIALGVYGEEFIGRVGVKSLADLEAAAPNINFGRGGRSSRGEIAIRGIGDFSRNIGTDARVAVYLDDVLTGRSSSFDQGLLDVDHVEILRGPQGTLAGSNALAGSINIITKKPTDSFSAGLLVDTGSYDLQSLTGKVNAPLSENLFGSLLMGSTQQSGFIRNITLGRDLQGTDRDMAKFKLRYVGLDQLTLDLGFDYLKDSNQSTNAEALANGLFNGFSLAPDPFTVAHDADEFERRKLQGASLKANYETANNFILTSITGLRKSEFSELSEEDYSPLDVATSLFDEKNDQFSQELRIASPQTGQFDYVFGAYFLKQNISTQRNATTGIYFRAAPNASVTTPATAEVQSSAIYLHGNYALTPALSFTSGIRYVHEEKEIDFSSIDTIGMFINIDHLRDQQTFNELLPKFGINFQLTPSVLLYGSVARGFKSGGWNADFITSVDKFNFAPEFALNYELGAKTSLWSNRLTINSALFVTKLDDFQVFQFLPTVGGGTLLSLTNAGKVTSQGVELDIGTSVTESLRFSVNAAFTQARFDEFKNGGGLGINYDKNYLPYAPKLSYFLALDYSKAVGRELEIYANLNYGYKDNYFSNPNNTVENSIPHQYLINARIGLEVGNDWDISLWAKNFTDEINLRQRSVSFLGVPRGYYDPPRSYGLSLSYSFD